MDIGSSIYKFFKWVLDELLEKVNKRLDNLEQKDTQREEEIKRLVNLCGQVIERVSKLEGKYENMEEAVYQRLVNRFQSELIKIKNEQIKSLEHQLQKTPSKQEDPSATPK